MSRHIPTATLCLAFCALYFAGPAGAIDDRFDPSKYDKGGFAAVSDPAYASECGSCHFAYLPGMLPARSWQALMARSDHFGESLSLSPEVARNIERFLVSHAADRSEYRGSEVILYRLPADAAPTRITALPVMREHHVVIRKLQQESRLGVRNLTNCDSCHEKAAAGSFAFSEIVVHGVTKVVRPGGMF